MKRRRQLLAQARVLHEGELRPKNWAQGCYYSQFFLLSLSWLGCLIAKLNQDFFVAKATQKQRLIIRSLANVPPAILFSRRCG